MYGWHLPELREVAEAILQEIGDADTEWQWMRGTPEGEGNVAVKALDPAAVEEWSDGSRIDERAAGATRVKSLYLGSFPTVADAEEVGVMLAWEKCDVVAPDSKGAIQRIWSLQFCAPRSWIEEELRAQSSTAADVDLGERA